MIKRAIEKGGQIPKALVREVKNNTAKFIASSDTSNPKGKQAVDLIKDKQLSYHKMFFMVTEPVSKHLQGPHAPKFAAGQQEPRAAALENLLFALIIL